MPVIAVDAMGGDYAPSVVIDGVGEWLERYPQGGSLLLVGDEAQVQAELKRIGKAADPRLTVVHAPEVIRMDDAPASAVRSKRRSSINVAVDLVKQGKAQAFFSAGNTGACVASTVLKWRTLPGIFRPGIATVFPSPEGNFVLLDAGSTVDCDPLNLMHYAVMGDVYCRHILGKAEPRIGLLNVGGEDAKGNDLAKESFKMLSGMDSLNFIGNVEGHDLFGGRVDVVVCDCFVGNVVLKTCESLAHAISQMIRTNLSKNLMRKAGYLLSRGAYVELKQMVDCAEFGGAPLLGVDGVCIIGHGSSCARAVRNGIRVAAEFVQHQVNTRITERVRAIGLAPAPAAGTPG
ncbi:MAG: phosphate acyltransferase PlsX [Lentisphaerae bacterium]|nr:phosphate acyltransferase PlsX [Lentisphaerota bacterium]